MTSSEDKPKHRQPIEIPENKHIRNRENSILDYNTEQNKNW